MAKLPEPTPPLTDEQLAAIEVGGTPAFSGEIVIADYDPEWPKLYEREAARLRDVLGPVALDIDHVGSTSVPGLPAKPIIDIDLVVPDSADEPAYVPALEAAGYVLRVREPDWYEHRMFKGPDTNINLHVFSPDCEERERHLVLRDWMRTHPEDRDVYAQVKRELATREWRNVNEYSVAKTEVIIALLTKAGLR